MEENGEQSEVSHLFQLKTLMITYDLVVKMLDRQPEPEMSAQLQRSSSIVQHCNFWC